MSTVHCPDCGTDYPNNDSTGHCGACHATFYGLASFEAHRVGPFPNGRHCQIQPYETPRDDGTTRYGHWQDNRGRWHHGRRLTTDERNQIFGQRTA